jgi:hypothetical protein
VPRCLAALTGLLFCCGTALRAQTVTLGLKAGATSAHFVSNDWNYYGNRKAPTMGVQATLRLGPVVAIRLEALYVEKGSIGAINMRLRYIEVPALLRLSYPRPVFGAEVAGLIGVASARETGCHLVVWDVSGIPEDPTPAMPREYDCWSWRQTGLDFGLVGGLEIERRLPVGRLSLEVRYTRGTRDLASRVQCCRLENRTWAILAGYAVALMP